jgi:hypothetical protein
MAAHDAGPPSGTDEVRDRRVASDARPVLRSGPRIRTTVAIPIRGGVVAQFITFDGLACGVEHFALRASLRRHGPARGPAGSNTFRVHYGGCLWLTAV